MQNQSLLHLYYTNSYSPAIGKERNERENCRKLQKTAEKHKHNVQSE